MSLQADPQATLSSFTKAQCNGVTIVALNCYNIINVTQGNSQTTQHNNDHMGECTHVPRRPCPSFETIYLKRKFFLFSSFDHLQWAIHKCRNNLGQNSNILSLAVSVEQVTVLLRLQPLIS